MLTSVVGMGPSPSNITHVLNKHNTAKDYKYVR